MRRSRALVAVICGLSSVPAHAESPGVEDGPCAQVTRDLKSQIEAMKLLKAQPPPLRLTDPLPDGRHRKVRKTESPQVLLARSREQANALNAILPGLGCAGLDIDRELAKPLDAALLPVAPKSRKHGEHERARRPARDP